MPVSLSLGVMDLFKVLIERNNRNREATIRYLEAVVQSARLLAEVWSSAYTQLAQAGDATLIPDGSIGWNISPYSRLEEFYRTASAVLGRNPALHDSFVERLARLLVSRKITKDQYQQFVAQADRMKFLETANREVSLDDLRESVEALHREVAALEVLLERFRAIGE